MHLPTSVTSVRDRSFYANFYIRHPSEIEIIEKTPPVSTSVYVVRTLSESPTTLTPISDVSSSATSAFFSLSDYSSSESTSSYTRRRRTTAPIIQERLNTYESACLRPKLPPPTFLSSKVKPHLISPPTLVNQITPPQRSIEQTDSVLIQTSNYTNNDRSAMDLINQDEPLSSASSSKLIRHDPSMSFDSTKRYLSKSTSQLCDPNSTELAEEQVSVASSSRNILDIIQEELTEIRRTDHDLKKMFLSIYDKIQTIQQLKSGNIQAIKGQRSHYHHNERPSRSIPHSCYSSNSDIRRSSCTHHLHHHHHHHTRKYGLHTAVSLRHRMNYVRASSTADNDSYVDTDSTSSLSDSGTCSSPVDNEPCGDD